MGWKDGVTMYTRNDPPCNFCDQAKTMLQYYGIEYNNIVIGEDISRLQFIDKYPQIKTVPAVFFGNEYIGGQEELSKRVWELPVGNPATHG